MSASDKGGGDESTPRDIPEYVQRHFKLKRGLGLDKIEEEPEPDTTVHSTTPPGFLSNPPPGLMDVDNVGNVSTTAGHEKSLDGQFDREAQINEQEVKDKPTSPAPPPRTLPVRVRVAAESTRSEIPRESGSAMSVEDLATQEATLGSDITTPGPRKSKLQEYADEVYQNTVVKYLERVRRGEVKVPTDQDSRTYQMWFERYGAWMAKQKQTEQQKLQDEGFPEPFPPPKKREGNQEHQGEGFPEPLSKPKKGKEKQEYQDEGLPEPFPPPNKGKDKQENQDEGLPEPFPPPREQRKGG